MIFSTNGKLFHNNVDHQYKALTCIKYVKLRIITFLTNTRLNDISIPELSSACCKVV